MSEINKVKIEILKPSDFITTKGKFRKDEAIEFSGLVAGECYDKEGFNHIVQESDTKTQNRVNLTIGNGHHSVNDHVRLTLNMHNVPKIIAMVLNDERDYSTSEKSARYTPVVRQDGSIITEDEERLYNKWLGLLEPIIKDKYGYIYDDKKVHKLAQENARYMVTVFMPTEMIHTISFRQINYIASFMQKYINGIDKNDDFQVKLAGCMQDFIDELVRLNILDERLMRNEKHRSLLLFGKDLDKREIHFGDVYATRYDGSFAQLAQAQRHRTLRYQMEMYPEDEKSFYVPEIITPDKALSEEWLADINSVKQVNPQGEKVKIYETGCYDDFILKSKERLCSAAQLEIMKQTLLTMKEYEKALKESDHYLAEDIQNYMHGARCTFPDYECPQSCKFNEGITLQRKI